MHLKTFSYVKWFFAAKIFLQLSSIAINIQNQRTDRAGKLIIFGLTTGSSWIMTTISFFPDSQKYSTTPKGQSWWRGITIVREFSIFRAWHRLGKRTRLYSSAFRDDDFAQIPFISFSENFPRALKFTSNFNSFMYFAKFSTLPCYLFSMYFIKVGGV